MWDGYRIVRVTPPANTKTATQTMKTIIMIAPIDSRTNVVRCRPSKPFFCMARKKNARM
ncbi:hypothetical protein DANISAUR_73 [Proteus phage vB_PmiS_DanisaurMW]|nr:hypothetical protein DANISAUR_73 [Proteus phage vB_PmiS_DanisaurMW]